MDSRIKFFNEIESFYSEILTSLPVSKQFHYASRLYLWSRNEKYKYYLDRVYPQWWPGDKSLRDDLENASLVDSFTGRLGRRSHYRRSYYERHPKILGYNKALFKLFFHEIVFGCDSKQIIPEHLISDIRMVYQRLIADPEACLYLSTPAVNFLHLAPWSGAVESPPTIDYFLEAMNMSFKFDLSVEFHARIYFATHVIINAAKFYSQPISTPESYRPLYIAAETMLGENFQAISLDQKFELLVCARILKIKSPLEKLILDEALGSSSMTAGHFLVNTLNSQASSQPTTPSLVEHSNVLALMAFAFEIP